MSKNFIKHYLTKLYENFYPAQIQRKSVGYHGSDKDRECIFKIYWSNIRCDWTSFDDAFRDHVMENIKPIIREVIKEQLKKSK